MAQEPVGPVRHLGVLDAMAVVIGIVVGAGIFRSPSLVAANTGSSGWMLAVWAFGGLLCLAGALTYAELASAYPRVGGEYVFLSRAFGRGVGFLFAWARTTVIQTGSIAATAYIFGDYMDRVLSLGAYGPLVWALAATVVLTVCNVVGLRAGRWTQNVLTAVKVAGVLAIVGVGLLAASAPAPAEPAAVAEPAAGWPGFGALGLAMVFVLYTYGGWNEAAYVAGELKRQRAGALWVLLGSILLLTGLYVAANLAYVQVLGIEGVASAEAVAAEAMLAVGGPWAERAVTVLVAVAALGQINACIWTGSRAICGVGEDFRPLRWLGRWSRRSGTPAAAVLLQSGVAVVLIVLPNLGEGFEEALGSGFQAAVEYTAPVFWLFFLLTGASALVLRAKEPEVTRPFRIPLYPATPLVFCLMCAYMLYSSVAYTRLGAMVGVGVLAVGVPVYLVFRERPKGRGA
ncbi:MAG: amino acid permease [Phycisphaerae bacterium]